MDNGHEENEDFYGPDNPPPRKIEEIEPFELPQALGSLTLFNDSYLTMQSHNLAIVDQFIMTIEKRVGRRLMDEDRAPFDDAMFLNAQSQMWIFALYEVLRTWQQQAKNIVKWHPNKMLPQMIERLMKPDGGFRHPGKERRAEQLQHALDNPEIIDAIKSDLRRVHIPFSQIEMLRIALAKHEDRGKKYSVAIAPGYARINRMTGSLQYELGSGKVIFGYISRREIADGIRALPHCEPPDDESLRSFDTFMNADIDDLNPSK